MNGVNPQQYNKFGIQELTDHEVEYISGAGVSGKAALGAAAAIGTAAFGSGWGAWQ